MDRFEAMEIFTRVVEANSFTKVSESLDLPRAKVSRTIQALEEHVGVRLLNRSTRQVSVTEDGASFYERCVRILADVADAESSLSNKRENPAGTIRVDTSGTLARSLLLPALDDFYEQYPAIDVRLGLADRNIDLIQDGVDCVIRMGTPEESSLVAKRIGLARIVTCASPAYLRKFGTPTTLADLGEHRAVNYVSARSGRTFPFEFEVDGEIERVAMDSTLAVNDGSVYITAGVLGHGIIQPSRFMVAELIEQGALTEILGNYTSPGTPLSILYAHRRNLSSRLRAFIDWVGELARSNPDLRLPESA
ncbi:LysR family transcriptional regulator for bpeEF and oprC [Paraburkholderia atlantica]|uniref:LysR family transcriptional regulator for bpeEF and oprC n=1 Tax=Paraburkholderia atlantica TaxID=2654982 RepID=A0A6I1PPR3_PARAM|nr:LysR family transcriptional regulator [Paraburkholderia atlantica]MBB5416479.1 LysR family transcriptional regulator for bpeEF and oprC [Paraburkholderia atlantica]MBB5426364.1 LysR family transcriptional regulator for bpeEF and oprC [Paraburkholderia atlantica]MPW04225.1 LysR family transcriptional regulator [Paraburkholderia atlantica]NUY29846.1 LysR family transcriptional regulator [Paraburkholderia atlantica]